MTAVSGLARVRRPVVVLAALAVGAALFVVTTRPWATAEIASALGGSTSVDATGADAAPLVSALALVALAAAGALSIAGRRARVVVLGVLLLAGVAATSSAVDVLRDPDGAVREQVAAATGVTAASVDPAATSAGVTGWVGAATVLAVLLVVVALAGLAAARTWTPRERRDRFTTAAAAPAVEPADDVAVHPADSWDALTRGDDPTGDSGRLDDAEHGNVTGRRLDRDEDQHG